MTIAESIPRPQTCGKQRPKTSRKSPTGHCFAYYWGPDGSGYKEGERILCPTLSGVGQGFPVSFLFCDCTARAWPSQPGRRVQHWFSRRSLVAVASEIANILVFWSHVASIAIFAIIFLNSPQDDIGTFNYRNHHVCRLPINSI